MKLSEQLVVGLGIVHRRTLHTQRHHSNRDRCRLIGQIIVACFEALYCRNHRDLIFHSIQSGLVYRADIYDFRWQSSVPCHRGKESYLVIIFEDFAVLFEGKSENSYFNGSYKTLCWNFLKNRVQCSCSAITKGEGNDWRESALSAFLIKFWYVICMVRKTLKRGFI